MTPTCATCQRFAPGAKMLDPATMRSIRTGDCTPGPRWRLETDTCAQHVPCAPPPAAPAAEAEAA